MFVTVTFYIVGGELKKRGMSDHPRGSDQLLTSLKILGRLRQHERVSTTGDIVRIDGQQGMVQAIRRWWNGENREKNLETIGRIVDSAFAQLEMIHAQNNDGNKVFALRLRTELRSTMQGLENLQSTYEDDSVSHARIEVLVDRIRTRLETAAAAFEEKRSDSTRRKKRKKKGASGSSSSGGEVLPTAVSTDDY